MTASETETLPPRYREPELIGRGGMGEIFRAKDTVLGRTVVVKLLAADRAAHDEVRARFLREGHAAARLSAEPNTVTVFDVGEHDGRPFLVMEYLPGGSLDDRLRAEGAQDPGRALAWLEQAARALDAAHRHGVVHRDVKPGNLLLDRDDEVRVADFGIASTAGLDPLTLTGTVLGTAGYLAPEQAVGSEATAATDCYALGVVGFELLTGTRPFAADSATVEAAAHAHAPIPSAAARRRGLPTTVDAVFARVLAKEPRERYPSCGEFVAALGDALTGGASVTVPLTATPRRVPWLAILAVALPLALAGAALAVLLARDDDPLASAGPTTVVTTITAPGTTEQVTVTATAPTLPAPEGGLEQGIALTDQATELMREERWDEALAFALRALTRLSGSGHPYEAYAHYDAGRSLAELGRCDEAIPHLDRSERLQGPRRELGQARRLCRRDRGRDDADD